MQLGPESTRVLVESLFGCKLVPSPEDVKELLVQHVKSVVHTTKSSSEIGLTDIQCHVELLSRLLKDSVVIFESIFF